MCSTRELIFSIMIVSVSARREPVISHSSPDIVVNVGDSATLECSVQFLSGLPLHWMKMTPFVVFIADQSKSEYARFVVRHEAGSSTYQLQINDIQETDGGLYECRVLISPTNIPKRHINLRVRVAPIIAGNSSRSESADEGQRIELHCYAYGNPQPNITWRRENNALLPSGAAIHRGNTLVIKKVEMEHRGTYFCVADNGVDYGVKRNVYVEVNFAPSIYVYRPYVYQALANAAILSCDVESFPAAQVTWFKGKESLEENSDFRISLIILGDYKVTSTLLVKQVHSRYFGNYTCAAENSYGSSEGHLVLRTSDNAVCPPACDQKHISYFSAATAVFCVPTLLSTLVLSAVIIQVFART